MPSLVEFAENELKVVSLDGNDPFEQMARNDILSLIRLFSSQGHSGYSAKWTVSVFTRLAMFQPLTPLTGSDDEWMDDDSEYLQNRRCFSVFKEKSTGRTYRTDAVMFLSRGSSIAYTNMSSIRDITFPYTVCSPEIVEVDDA